MKNSKIYSIFKTLLMVAIFGIIISSVISYVRDSRINIDIETGIKVKSDFLQMQLEDPTVADERNFIGKLHFEVSIPQRMFEARHKTKSRFVKDWFENKSEVMIFQENNSYVSGDFDFINSNDYVGDNYLEYKESFRSEIYFNTNGYKINIPTEALDIDGRIKEDYEFNFVITVQTVFMNHDSFIFKSGVIIQQNYEFNFNVINNGIIKFDEESNGELKTGKRVKTYFREYPFAKGKVVKP